MRLQTILKLMLSSIFVVLLNIQTAFADLNPQAITQINPKTLRQVGEMTFSGGQPSQAELEQLKAAGITTIINLRPRSEMKWDEQALVTALGINYYHLPIGSLKDLSSANAAKLRQLLDDNADTPTLVHCKSGNRVGALIAIGENEIDGVAIEPAIDEGKRWGLTGLEKVVRKQLH